MGFIEWLSATAVSFTISGNTGVAPFFSLFLVGLLEKTNPDLLYMDGTIEWILSSWFSIIVLGILCVLEFVGKCIPVIDEVIDSALTFVVPIFSVLGSLSTFGLFTMSSSTTSSSSGTDDVVDAFDDENRRRLSVVSGALVFFQVIVVVIGIILALCLHGLKMIVRLLGEGCLTNCITVLEYTWIGFSITLAVFIREVAVCIAILFCFAAVYVIKRRYVDKKTVEQIAQEDGNAVRSAVVVVVEQEQQASTSSSGTGGTNTSTQQDFVKMDDDEEQPTAATSVPAVSPSAPPSEASTLMENK
jgi:Domain of unknown function (DUF4126)